MKDIQSDLVLTLLFHCDKRVSVCYGCGDSFRYNENDPQLPFHLASVIKLRRKYFKDREKYYSSPSSVYFHVQIDNPFAPHLDACEQN